MQAKYPPGPRDGRLGISFYKPFRADPLAFAVDVAEKYGDFTFVRLGWVRLYFVNRPELIRDVLATKVKSFRKLGRQMRSLRKIEGEGLVVSEGTTWSRHRPVVQGSFHGRHFGGHGNVVVEYTQRRMERWTAGEPINIADEMNELALEIIAKIVFDVDLSDDAARLRDAVHSFRTEMQKEVSGSVHLPDWLPLPGKIRQKRAVQVVNDLIWSQIRERRTSDVPRNDMLAQMLTAASAAPVPISDAEIRDEAATLFVAGHDTTSAALAWFWLTLMQNPLVEERVLREIGTVLGGRTPTAADVPKLHYLERVVKESMRLYPAAAFLFGREAIEDVEIGGFTISKGSWVFIAPYVVHHDARNFPDPEVCDPERFAPGRIEQIPAYAYIPFGGGPRICIGNALATMQIILMAATVLQKYRVTLAQPTPEHEMEVVLRPKGGLRVLVESRAEVQPIRRAA
ncbi:MAG: cytochrome P450 [Gemmataceae bacterium]|nr:cytochrome P450 [Gemmataceae bacterium]